MSHTLLLRLAGPMQSWGVQSRFSIRDTLREPTKSGVLGLLCAALGKPRQETPADGFPALDTLRALHMGVRVDREGQLRRDFQTAMDVAVASSSRNQIERGKAKTKPTEPSERFYLADAWFVVGLSGDDPALLKQLDAALAAPRWSLSLGRKALVPGWPVKVHAEGRSGVVAKPLAEALAAFDDPLWPPHLTPDEPRRYVYDAAAAPSDGVARRMQPDQPRSFHARRYLPRDVVTVFSPSTHEDDVPQ